MASQARIVACGGRLAAVAMAAKFIAGPGLMAISSFAVGLRETLLKVAIVQVAYYWYLSHCSFGECFKGIKEMANW